MSYQNLEIEKIRCLVVDDFDMVRHAIRKALNQLGVTEIIEARDGVQAIRFLQDNPSKPVNIIFSDWNMPEMNGLDFLRACKKDPELKHIPLVMVTSEGERDAILEAIKHGAHDYIVKPFSAVTIAEKIKNILEQKRASHERS